MQTPAALRIGQDEPNIKKPLDPPYRSAELIPAQAEAIFRMLKFLQAALVRDSAAMIDTVDDYLRSRIDCRVGARFRRGDPDVVLCDCVGFAHRDALKIVFL